MFIVGKLIVNKLKQDNKLFVKNAILLFVWFLQHLAGKSKLQKKWRKKLCIKNKAEHDGFVETKALNKSKIKIKNSYK